MKTLLVSPGAGIVLRRTGLGEAARQLSPWGNNAGSFSASCPKGGTAQRGTHDCFTSRRREHGALGSNLGECAWVAARVSLTSGGEEK